LPHTKIFFLDFTELVTMAEHELKTWPEYFDEVYMDTKAFEVRKNDRDFKVGQTIRLREFDPKRNEYTGRTCLRFISYILDGGQFGVEKGYVVLSLKKKFS